MTEYKFGLIQYGYWGQAPKRDRNGRLKQIWVKAPTLADAELIVRQRKDNYKRLRNGDSVSWFFLEQEM